MTTSSKAAQYFEVAFGSGPVAMTLTEVSPTADRVIIEANEAMARLLGYPRDQLAGMSFVELTHPDDLADDDVGTARQASGDTDSFSTRKRYVRSDGSTVWVQLHVAIVEKDADRVVTVGHAIDITGEVAAEQLERRRVLLSTGLSEIRQTLLHRDGKAAALHSACGTARQAVNADAAIIVGAASDGRYQVEAQHGTTHGLDDIESSTLERMARTALEASSPYVLPSDEPLSAEVDGLVVALPLRDRADPESDEDNVLVVVGCRCDATSVETTVADMSDFAVSTSAAIDLAETRDLENQVGVFEDRERIAREMHDHVIGRLFATGMQLQVGVAGTPEVETLTERVTHAVNEIDEAIKDIRNAIYGPT